MFGEKGKLFLFNFLTKIDTLNKFDYLLYSIHFVNEISLLLQIHILLRMKKYDFWSHMYTH